MSTQPDIITRLGYDGTELRKGFQQALLDEKKYKAEAALLQEELRKARLRLQSEFSREHRKQAEERIAQIRTELAQNFSALSRLRGAQRQAAQERIRDLRQEFEAQQKVVKGHVDQVREVQRLATAQAQLRAQASRAGAAAGVFREQGRQTGEIPGLGDIVKAGLGDIAPRLSQIVSRFQELAPAANAGATSVGLLGSRAALTATIVGGLAAATVGATKAIADAALETGKWADNLVEISQQTAIPVQKLAELEFIGQANRLTLEDLLPVTRELGKNMSEGAEAFTKFNISTHDFAGNLRDPFEVLLDIADLFERLPGQLERVEAARELLGRGGQRLINLLMLGRTEINALREEFRKIGIDIEATAAIQDEYEKSGARVIAINRKQAEKFNIVTQAITGLKNAYFELLNTAPKDPVALGAPVRSGGTGPDGAPPAPIPLVTAPEFQLGQFANLRPKAPDTEAVKSARRALEEQRQQFARKALSDIQRTAALQAELNKLKQLEVTLSGKPLEENLKRQKELEAEVHEIEKRRVEERKRLTDQIAQVSGAIERAIDEQEKVIAEAQIKAAPDDFEKLDAIINRQQAIREEMAALASLRQIQEDNAHAAQLSDEARIAEGKKLAETINRQNELMREQISLSQQSEDATTRILRGLPLGGRGQGLSLGVAPVPAAFRDFEAELARLRVQEATGADVLREELAVREALNASLIDQIKLRLASGTASETERQKLESLVSELKQNRDAINKVKGEMFNRSGLGQFVSTFRQFSDIIGKFSAGLNKTLSQLFAVAEGFGVIANQLRLLGGGTQDANGRVTGGSVFSGIGNLFRRGSGLSGGQRISGLLGLAGAGIGGGQLIAQLLRGGFSGPGRGAGSGALLGGLGAFGLAFGSSLAAGAGFSSSALGALGFLGGPLGLAIIGGAAGLGALFGAQKKKTRNIAKQIREEIKESLTAFNEGRSSLKDTIATLERERADAIRRLSGKKGGKKELEPILAELDKQLSDLRARQKQILEDFSSKAAIFKVPEGARDAAEAIAGIAKELKAAADAGASAADQITFLNGALEELKNKIGRDLRDEELETIDLLREQIDLQKQRADIIKQADEAELAVKRRAGLERALTPGQAAALEIKAIREQKAEKLKELEEREALLKAELEGRAELFGIELEGLDVQAQRTALLDRQVALTREMTAELIAQIRAQQDFYRDLAAGRIPALPAGVLPVGFNAPRGNGISIHIERIDLSGRLTESDERRRLERMMIEITQRMRTGQAS